MNLHHRPSHWAITGTDTKLILVLQIADLIWLIGNSAKREYKRYYLYCVRNGLAYIFQKSCTDITKITEDTSF